MSDTKESGIVGRVKRSLGGLKDRASWAIANGKLATDIQDKTKEQIRTVLQATIDDPETAKALGLRVPAAVTGAAAPEADIDSRDLAQLAAEGLSRLAVVAAQRAGYSDRVSQVAAFSVPEREKLIPALMAVIKKYLPATLGKYAEELALAASLGAIIAAKVSALREAGAQESQLKAAA